MGIAHKLCFHTKCSLLTEVHFWPMVVLIVISRSFPVLLMINRNMYISGFCYKIAQGGHLVTLISDGWGEGVEVCL